MKKLYFLFLLGLIGNTAYSQEFPGRRPMNNNGIKPQIDIPIIRSTQARNATFHTFKGDISKRKFIDEESGAVAYIQNLDFSRNAKNAKRNMREMSFDFLNSVKSDLKVKVVKDEFTLLDETTDEQGIRRVKMQQRYLGVPIYGAELGLHSNKNGIIEFMMGRVFPTPTIDIKPNIVEQQAINFAYADLKKTSIVQKTGLMKSLLDFEPDKGELFILNRNGNDRLVYELTLRPNILERWIYFVDAHNGEIVEKYNHTCTVDGVITATSRDLNNVNQAFNAYQIGSDYVLIDTKKKMFKPSQSQMPDSPVGAIITVDARNAQVDNENMDLYHVATRNPSSWDATAVSAHTNASKSYDYYEQKHGRLSLNGKGGNIISVINLKDEDGTGMDNAFWNGVYMGYGNGNKYFKPLAGGLDVAGHEMTHGVIESTAKLEYRNQSGALNESFADIFGVLIDSKDWTVGEDVIIKSQYPSGAMRSMQNPNQGGKQDPGYQPMYMSQYVVLRDTPQEDNGGVHVNSGIPNHAFYLFSTASGMNRDKAEKVYYQALTKYLGRTSKFLDLRLAVIQSAKDLYGDGTEVSAARAAFDKVGIVESGGSTGTPSNPSKDSEVQANPGSPQIVAFGSNANDQRLYLANYAFQSNLNFKSITGQVGCLSKPSITDNGEIMVFVGNDQKIHAYDLKNNQNLNFSDNTGIKWYNVAISKDGTRLAAIADETQNNNYIYVFNLAKDNYVKFELYNPTYSEGVNSGKVLYAEALEWDLTGQFVVYDAANQVGGWFSKTRTFYDIGFLRAWNTLTNDYGDGSIEKLINDVPEGVSIGNPTFAKTNSGIMAFDMVDEEENKFYIFTIDLNGSDDAINTFETSTIGFPDFSKTDEHLIFNYTQNNKNYVAGLRLAKDKITPDLNSLVDLGRDKSYGVSFAVGNRTLPQIQQQTITVNTISDKTPGSSFDIEATVSSGLPLVYTLVSGNASISGKRISLGKNPGKVLIRVVQVGDSKYAAASKDADFCIIPPAPVLTDNGSSVTASGGSLYQLYVNGNAIGGFTSNTTFKKDLSGDYRVKSVTQDGCSSTFSNVITNQKILGKEPDNRQIFLLPNPVEDILTVGIPEDEVLKNIEIINSEGKTLIQTVKLKNVVKDLPSGLYIVKVETDKNKYSSKMVKL